MINMNAMQLTKAKTDSVYIRVMSYKNKKLAFSQGLTVYDAEADKVLAIIKKAIERASNGKR